MTIDTEVKQIDRRQIDINPNSFSFILQITNKNYLSCNSQTENLLYVLHTSEQKHLANELGKGIYSYWFLLFLFPF